MSVVSDLEVYQRLTAAAEEFDRLVAQGVSMVGAAALNTASRSLRGMAKVIYEHSLALPDQDATPQ